MPPPRAGRIRAAVRPGSCGCAAEYYERTICVVCVTRLQRSWTIIHRPALPCGTVSPATKARIDSAWASMGTNVHAPRALRMLSSEVWCQSVMTSSQSAPSVIPMVLFHQRKAKVARVQGRMRRGACFVPYVSQTHPLDGGGRPSRMQASLIRRFLLIRQRPRWLPEPREGSRRGFSPSHRHGQGAGLVVCLCVAHIHGSVRVSHGVAWRVSLRVFRLACVRRRTC